MSAAQQIKALDVGGELNSSILIAKSFPRDLEKCIEKIENFVSRDEETAQSCFYTLTRGKEDKKTTFSGPSIRLAEICASFWGNIHLGSYFISNNGERVVSSGECWDTENNFKVTTEVSKSIMGKHGRYSTDMQEVTAAAAASMALRNAVFKVIPRIIVEKSLKIAMDVAVNGNKKESIKFEKRRELTLERIQGLGINLNNVLAFFNKQSVDEIDSEELKIIIGVGTSVKDGMLNAKEAFIPHPTKADEIASMIEGEE